MYSANTRGWVYLARQGRAGKGVIGSIGTQWEWSRSGQLVPCGYNTWHPSSHHSHS